MDLSVVIPCFEHAEELEICLRQLRARHMPMDEEVIVVDSASDPRVAEVTNQFHGVLLVRSPTRLFPGEARNLGVRHSARPYLAFLDSDCIPSERWIETAVASLRAGHTMVGGPVLDMWPVRPIAWVDNRLQFADFQAGREAGPGNHFPACNLAITREAFTGLGGFAERIPTGEDMEFSERALRLIPERMWFNPQFVVRHHGRGSLRSMLEHQQLLGRYRGRLRLAMTPAWNRLAGSPWFSGLAILRRLGYIFLRTLQYDPGGLLRLALSLPLLLSGLTAWTHGFYQGVRWREQEHQR